MTCTHAQRLLDDLADNELASPVLEQVREHLKSCCACREDHSRTRRLKDLLKKYTVYQPAQPYWNEVSRLINARTVESAGFQESLTTPAHTTEQLRTSFVRSIISVLFSLTLLAAALILGSFRKPTTTEKVVPIDAVMTRAGLVAMANTDTDMIITRPQQDRIEGGTLLLGPAGLLGRFTGITQPVLSKGVTRIN